MLDNSHALCHMHTHEHMMASGGLVAAVIFALCISNVGLIKAKLTILCFLVNLRIFVRVSGFHCIKFVYID